MRVLPSYPEGHKTAHREAGYGPVLPVSNGFVMDIYIVNQFGKIDRELALGFNGTDIVRSKVILIIWIPVISIRFDHNNVVAGHIIGDIITIVFISTIISVATGNSKISLGPAMVKIDDRVSIHWIVIVAWRQEYPVVPHLPQNIAVMPGIDNRNIIFLGEGCTANQHE
jgi:hypothetical protein